MSAEGWQCSKYQVAGRSATPPVPWLCPAGCDACTRWTAYRAAKGVVLLLLWLLMAGLIFIAMLFFASGAALYGAETGALGAQR
jgi:hypothetical protein